MNIYSRKTTVILVVILLAGLSLVLYPSVSNYLNSFHQSRAIAAYSEKVDSMSSEDKERMLEEAREYNSGLRPSNAGIVLNSTEWAKYLETLDITGTGIMGYIEIPKIDVRLPVYHGTDEGVLQVAAGHLEWSSLPVGGISTHCAVSGHRGLPSASLFTHLDALTEGDSFMLKVLNEVLTYQVDKILIVEPEQVDDLRIVEGEDLCTLVTCTPYGVNSHRLLVRGHRIENVPGADAMSITAEASQIDQKLTASVIAIPVLLLILGYMLRRNRRNFRSGKGENDNEILENE